MGQGKGFRAFGGATPPKFRGAPTKQSADEVSPAAAAIAAEELPPELAAAPESTPLPQTDTADVPPAIDVTDGTPEPLLSTDAPDSAARKLFFRAAAKFESHQSCFRCNSRRHQKTSLFLL